MIKTSIAKCSLLYLLISNFNVEEENEDEEEDETELKKLYPETYKTKERRLLRGK